jgi:predicted ArsR family transcriptional regulator
MTTDRPGSGPSTREQLTQLLRQAPRSADEVAAVLGLTANAVRQHLATLERDGILVRRGLRRLGTVGKPAMVYEVSAEAEAGYSKAYRPLLTALMAALPGHMSKKSFDGLLLDVSDRLTASVPAARGDIHERARAGAMLLDALGGLTEIIDQGDGSVVLAGCSCPLSDAVIAEPRLCGVVERMLATVTQLNVRECCDRDGHARCRFELRPTTTS